MSFCSIWTPSTILFNLKNVNLQDYCFIDHSSGRRVSTIHKFRLSQLQLTTDMAVFNLGNALLKHSKPGRSNPPIVFHRYPDGHRLCPIQTIRDYLQQRTPLAPQTDEFLSYPQKALPSCLQRYAGSMG